MQADYVDNLFSYFDSPTANIERALHDLEPVLNNYASSRAPGDMERRLADLRNILRQGARFAFALFGQTVFWGFNWKGGEEGDEEDGGDVGEAIEGGEEKGDDPNMFAPRRVKSVIPGQLIVWPCLLKVMDGEGRRLVGEDKYALGEKKYLKDFA
jgi:hypothetical protein